MKNCCSEEMKRHLKKHRDVARCDGCKSLLLAYDNQQDFEATQLELSHHGAEFEVEKLDTLWVIVKQA